MTIPYKEQRLPIEKVFRDPVHNYIHVQHQVILDLINSAEVQRLRRIKQLGTSSFTFPILWVFTKLHVGFVRFSNVTTLWND